MNDSTRELKIQTACLMVVAALAIGLALYLLRPVLVPFVLALFFAAGLAPILDLIEKRLGAPRLVAVAIAFLVGLVLLAVLWSFVWLSVQSLLDNRQMYEERIDQLIDDANARLPDYVQIPKRAGQPAEPVVVIDPNNPSPPVVAPHPLNDPSVRSYVSYGMSLISRTLLELSSNAVMVLIFMFFLLLGGSTSAIPRGGVWREIEGKIRGYIITKTVISALTGAAFALVLYLYGIPLALVFGLLAFLLNYIPNIGPLIASLLPLPLILLHPELSVLDMAMVIGLSAGVQFISGNVVETKVMGDSFELHPVAILLTLMVWGMIWGIVGMFLAVPMTAAVKILLARFHQTRTVADILAGRFESLTAMLDSEKQESKPA